MREIVLEALGDLLRTPRDGPAPVSPMRLVQPLPRWRCGSGDDRAIRPANCPTEPFLHVLPQPRIDRELRYLGALGRLLRLPLSHQRPVLELPAAGRRVTAHHPECGAGVPPDTAGDLTHDRTR